jgi:hypothetical protein
VIEFGPFVVGNAHGLECGGEPLVVDEAGPEVAAFGAGAGVAAQLARRVPVVAVAAGLDGAPGASGGDDGHGKREVGWEPGDAIEVDEVFVL